jgi:hypothetical protein
MDAFISALRYRLLPDRLYPHCHLSKAIERSFHPLRAIFGPERSCRPDLSFPVVLGGQILVRDATRQRLLAYPQQAFAVRSAGDQMTVFCTSRGRQFGRWQTPSSPHHACDERPGSATGHASERQTLSPLGP